MELLVAVTGMDETCTFSQLLTLLSTLFQELFQTLIMHQLLRFSQQPWRWVRCLPMTGGAAEGSQSHLLVFSA